MTFYKEPMFKITYYCAALDMARTFITDDERIVQQIRDHLEPGDSVTIEQE